MSFRVTRANRTIIASVVLVGCGKTQLRVRNDSPVDIAGVSVGTCHWTNITSGMTTPYQTIGDGHADVYITILSSNVLLGGVDIVGSTILSTNWTVAMTTTACTINRD